MARIARTTLFTLCLTLTGGLASTALAMGQNVPDRPLEGQRRAPCEKGQKEINGGCWLEVKQASGSCWFYQNTADLKCYTPINTAPVKKK